MREFKIGDRVRVYHNMGTYTGVVSRVTAGFLILDHDTNEGFYQASPQQCRLLRKKPPLREFYLQEVLTPVGTYYKSVPEGINPKALIHVREVRKKKSSV
jgi:hypothetical protein